MSTPSTDPTASGPRRPGLHHHGREILRRLTRMADELLLHARMPGCPLLVDALVPGSLDWLAIDVAEVAAQRVLSNLAFQQPFLRLLVGLSAVSDDESYVAAARETAAFGLESLTHDCGLLYWGGHVALDVAMQRPIAAAHKGWVHELKCCFPFYDLMFDAEPARAARSVEAFWNSQILDWSTLDFDRHGRYGVPTGQLWNHEFRGGPVRFWGRGLTFATAAADLIYAASMLAVHTDNDAALAWAKRLAGRYTETREPAVGLSSYQYSQKETAHCDGPRVTGDRARYQIAPVLSGEDLVLESTLFRPRPVVQRCLFQLTDALGSRAVEFKNWALEEVEAWARVAYRRQDNVFLPMLTSGRSLEEVILPHDGYFGSKGARLVPVPADGDFLWLYATAYHASQSAVAWDIARDITRCLGLGELGTPVGTGRRLQMPTGEVDYRSCLAFLELYRATAAEEFLDLAVTLAVTVLDQGTTTGHFVCDRLGAVVVGDPRPLALLTVAAEVLARSDSVPAFVGEATQSRW